MEKVFGKGSPYRSAAPKTAVNEPSDRSAALKTAVNELSDRSAELKTAVNELSDRSAAPKTAVNESSDRSDRLKGGSKNSGFKFLPILMFSISADFRLFRCHFVKSHQSHSPLCSFFNLQKHTQKKNENQLDIIFRTTLKRVVEGLIKC